ncbi:MAG: glycosyltransferase [Planctomycetes bacterium]|nr:glycosyltransferase [Planctomycetota bacterium]
MLDTVPGRLARPHADDAAWQAIPRVAWLVHTSKAPELHREVARTSDLVFHANTAWGPALGRPSTWLPVCADGELFRHQPGGGREWDVAFLGHETWRAEPLQALARRLGLRVLVREARGKAEAAAHYARTKLVFHAHSSRELDSRVLEGLAAGRVVLADRRDNGLEQLTEGRHVALYGDSRELEASILDHLAADAPTWEARELEAATWAHERHTAAPRTLSLLQAITDALGIELERGPKDEGCLAAAWPQAPLPRVSLPALEPKLRCPESRGSEADAGSTRPTGRRWLVLAGEEPAGVELASYAERIGQALRRRGDEVLVLRMVRRRLRWGGGPSYVVEVGRGPLPPGTTGENDMLLACSRAHAVVDRVLQERGPPQGLIVEPAFGALVGVPLGERLGLPVVLALEDSQVARRNNMLTREQLYLSELEHWTADRARAVIVPTARAAEAVQHSYGVSNPVVSGWPAAARVLDSATADRLRARLDLPKGASLVRAPMASPKDASNLAAELAARGLPVVVVGQSGLAVGRPHGAELMGEQPVVGPALGALCIGSARVLHVGREDLGAADLSDAADHFAVVDVPDRDVVLDALTSAKPPRPLPRWDPLAFERLAALMAPAQPPAELVVGGKVPT